VTNSGDENIVVNTNSNTNDYSSTPLELRVYGTNDNTNLNNLNFSTILQLYVYPDCSQETVIAPTTYDADIDYTIYDT
jgi:hypothetical protein